MDDWYTEGVERPITFTYPASSCTERDTCTFAKCEAGIANLAARVIPTHETKEESLTPTKRKENTNMDDILRNLREKLEEAHGVQETLDEQRDEITNAIEELDSYVDEVSTLIDTLDSLPSISIYVNLDRVDFES